MKRREFLKLDTVTERVGGDHDYDNGRPSPEDALRRMVVTEPVYHA